MSSINDKYFDQFETPRQIGIRLRQLYRRRDELMKKESGTQDGLGNVRFEIRMLSAKLDAILYLDNS